MKDLFYPSTYHAMKAGPCRVGVCKHDGECGKCEEYGLIRSYAARDTDRIQELSSLVKEMADEKRISDAVIKSLRDKKLEMAGEIAEKEAEIAKLRECMKEAIREKCPFTRMSCKHGETCDYECGTFKWRKALQDEGGADALFLKRKDKQ